MTDTPTPETPGTPEQPAPAPAQPPAQPAGGPPAGGPPQKPGNGMAIAGMVLGIVSLVIFCLWYISLPCAIVGLILSVVAKKKAKETGAGGGMATAGLVLCIIALGLAIVITILAIVGIAIIGSQSETWAEQMQKAAEDMEKAAEDANRNMPNELLNMFRAMF